MAWAIGQQKESRVRQHHGRERYCTDVGRSIWKRRKKRITPYMDLTITPVRKSRILPRGGRSCVVKDAMIALGTAIEAKGATMMLARGR